MKLFLKNNLGYITLFIVNFVMLFFLYGVFGGLKEWNDFIYFIALSSFNLFAYLGLKYFNENKLYKSLEKRPNNFEECLNSFGDSHMGNVLNNYTGELYNLYKYYIHQNIKKQTEHLNFINQWVHQMKTPLSVIKLIMQENEDYDCIRDMKYEIEKLEKGLNLALYNARLDTFEHDFNVKDFNLKELVLEVVNSNKILFIKNGVFPRVTIEDFNIKSDKKWISFILEQIISNGVKYSKGKGKVIEISGGDTQGRKYISVKDEGVGIYKKDLKRITEPFYTGENGRIYGESTGMGLYITNEVCKKLNHSLKIASNEGEGTAVNIYF